MFDVKQRPFLPSAKPYDYGVNEVISIGKQSAPQGMAASFGIPKRFLPLAEKTTKEDFAQHRFKALDFVVAQGELVQLSAQLQTEKVLELVDDWPQEHPLIIINAFPHVFLGSQECSSSVEHFLYHLLGAFANKATQSKTLSGADVSFLWLMNLELHKMYALKANHALVWGVLTEDPSAWDLSKTYQFMLNFSAYTRIILTSANNLAALLDKLRISPSYVDYIFNLDVNMPAKKEIPAAFKRKKVKPRKVNI